MEPFKIQKKTRPASISRSVRFKPEHYDRIEAISKKNGITFSKVVGQMIEYALAHYEEEEDD